MIIATITVSAAAAVRGPGVGSVSMVIAHKIAVRRTQIKPISLDANLMGLPFDMN
jgi:hypothetical protein